MTPSSILGAQRKTIKNFLYSVCNVWQNISLKHGSGHGHGYWPDKNVYYLEIELTKKLNDSTEILGMPMIFTFKAKSKIKKLRPWDTFCQIIVYLHTSLKC